MIKTPQTIPQIKAACDGEILERIQGLFDEGKNLKQAANELNVTASWMTRYVQKNAYRIRIQSKGLRP